MRRALEIAVSFTRDTGHRHPSLQGRAERYGGLLLEMGMTREQVIGRLREIAPEFFE